MISSEPTILRLSILSNTLHNPENLYLRSHVPLLKYVECFQLYYFPRKHYCKQSLEIQLYNVVISFIRNFLEIFPFCKKLEVTNTSTLKFPAINRLQISGKGIPFFNFYIILGDPWYNLAPQWFDIAYYSLLFLKKNQIDLKWKVEKYLRYGLFLIMLTISYRFDV